MEQGALCETEQAASNAGDAGADTVPEFSPRMLAAEVRQLSRVNYWRAAWAVSLQWLVIAGAVALALRFHHWAVWLVTGMVIATRQTALGVLMHEAAHYHLSSRKWLNDWIGDILCALPIYMTTAGYRYEHMRHHLHTNTPEDPTWEKTQQDRDLLVFPQGALKTLRVFVFDLLGLHIPRMMRYVRSRTYIHRLMTGGPPRLTAAEHVRWFLFHAALITFLAVTNGWIPYLLLWVVPSMTLGTVLFRIRILAEHPATKAVDEIHDTRFVEGTVLERLSIAPLNINYHLEHHLFPSVPCHHLPALHKLLVGRGIYRPGQNHFRSYLGLRHGVLGWLIGRGDSLPATSASQDKDV
jgi:fatty acid desaturase